MSKKRNLHSPYNPEFVQAHSGLHGSLLRAAHMPELRSGIVAALLENTYKVLSSCKHDCELSTFSLIAARTKKAPRLPRCF